MTERIGFVFGRFDSEAVLRSSKEDLLRWTVWIGGWIGFSVKIGIEGTRCMQEHQVRPRDRNTT